MTKRAIAGFAIAIAIAFALAVAAPGVARAGESVTALEQQLASEHTALSTADCNAACRALASIRRAADRICALEPGPRCEAARSKAEEATRRVREACPDCALAFTPIPSPEQPVVTGQAGPPPAADKARAEEGPRKGGCASCSSASSSISVDPAWLAFAAWLAARVVARRRNKTRPTP